jgi:hypothetical protein
MSARIGVGEVAVPAASYDPAGEHYDCTHRDFACGQGALGAAQSFFHPEFVGIGHRTV